jgi:uncharacterized protein (DUF885 family)
MRITRVLGAAAAGLSLLAVTACSADTGATDDPTEAGTEEALVVYSGRSEELVGPLLEDLEAAVGVPVEVRYGDSAELSAPLAEEGDRTPADVFFSQDAGALGALAKADLLGELPEDVLASVDPTLRDDAGRWVATSARARVIVHHVEEAPEVADFDSIDDVLDEKYQGAIGFAPTNASWQSFVTALRVMRGEEAAEEWLTEFAALDPMTATDAGIGGHDHEWPDLSPDGYAAREELDRVALAEVRALTPTDARETVARAAFLERIALHDELAEAGLRRCHVAVIASDLHALRETFDLMPTGSEADWANISQRLAAMPTALQQWRTTLSTEADLGRVVARRQYLEVADQVRSWTGRSGGTGVLEQLATTATDVPASLSADLERHAALASAALAETGRFLAEEMAPRGRENQAVGRDAYQLASRNFLGATIDLDETYAWGWEELRRITAEMQATADRIAPGADVAEAVARLEADPRRKLRGTAALQAWMQKLADRAVTDLAGTHFDIPEQVKRIECMIAPTDDGGIYYTGPSEDFSRPGRMWWSVPAGIEEFATWRETTTVFHEGVPGHHLQIGHAVARSELLNRWQRLLCWVSGHGEGWALYAERLMDELGYLDDPGDRLGMLDAQAFRAARVIVDIGMHLELEIPRDNPFGFHPGERWTPELGREFMGQHSLDDPERIDFEVKRYLGWPGQAPSYKVGERIWLQVREDARARLGADFDLKAFHRAALDLGSLGLDPFRDAVAVL